MITVIVIAIIIFFIVNSSGKKKQKNSNTNYTKKTFSENKTRNQSERNINNDIKISVASSSNYKDNSIIDVSGQSTRINSNYRMIKYSGGVPKWTDKDIHSFSEITKATNEQINFYNFYKKSFVNGEIVSLDGYTNYAFILMYELQSEYKKDKNLLKLETQLNKLAECWPATKPYTISFLKQKKEEVNISLSKSINAYSNEKYSKLEDKHTDDSIIDVTGQSSKIRSNVVLAKYTLGIPYWSHQYVYSFSEINQASNDQKGFYNIYKNSFLNGVYYKLEGNTNYAFILLFDLLQEYDNHKNISTLESQLKILGECYPKTKSYADSFLKQKKEKINISVPNSVNTHSNNNFHEDYWKLGNKYKDKLKLNKEEVELLNNIYNPSNNFFNIEYCGTEILKLYITVISELKEKYIQEGTTIEEQFLTVADIATRKQFRYRNGSQNYKYCIETIYNQFYTYIFKHCENTVREYYGHQRKISIINYGSVVEVKNEFETRINSKILEILLISTSKIAQPDESTEIELYTQNTSRWKIKFEQLVTNYNDKPQEFIDSIISLGKLNKKNPSVENIFFEASKFIANYDKESSLSLYIHYLYHDLKSATFDNKQHTKTIQKSLFKTNEELHDFEKIVSELIKDKDLEKALKQIPEIYKIKRKKLQLNRTSIKEVQQQHSATVELLNEYLKDDFEDENNTIKSQEINSEEIQIEITQKSEEVHQSAFISELTFTAIHTTALELFAKSNFSVSQSEFELFAKSKGVFRNQLIESINDTCYEFLDDVLIEEEDDFYTINTNYFQRISTK